MKNFVRLTKENILEEMTLEIKDSFFEFIQTGCNDFETLEHLLVIPEDALNKVFECFEDLNGHCVQVHNKQFEYDGDGSILMPSDREVVHALDTYWK